MMTAGSSFRHGTRGKEASKVFSGWETQKMTLGESTVTACLLIHSMKMQMLLLASEFPDSFTTCSSLRGTDFVHNWWTRFRLAYTFMLCSSSMLVECQRMRSAAVPGACSFSIPAPPALTNGSGGGGGSRELLQNRFRSSSAFARASAQDKLSAWILSACGCHVVSQEGPFS